MPVRRGDWELAEAAAAGEKELTESKPAPLFKHVEQIFRAHLLPVELPRTSSHATAVIMAVGIIVCPLLVVTQ
jgi:hypothetical protein